jgi:uncharacterized membrane protein SpoIIM required for sporulation
VGGLVAINVLLVRMGVRIFNREELLGREIDELSIKRGAIFWWRCLRGETAPDQSASSGAVAGLWRWYRREVLGALRRAGVPALVVLLALVGAVLVGMERATIWPIPVSAFEPDQWSARFGTALEVLGLQEPRGVLLILWQNLRVLAVSSLLAVFSFGVMAIVIAMLPVTIIGFLGANVYAAGVDPLFFWAAIVPHAVLELPAIVLATAGALRVGASVIAPPPGRTVGEGWLMALADLAKLWVGAVLPLLVGAAVLEIFVTPRIVLALMAGS